MFANLEGELKKKQITRQKIAEDMDKNIATVSRKLTETGRMKLSEAFKIRDLYCPGMSIDYLFQWSEPEHKAA